METIVSCGETKIMHEINRIAWSFRSEYLRVVKCSLSVSGDGIIVVTLLSPIAVTVLIVNNQIVKQQSVTGDRYIIKIIV